MHCPRTVVLLTVFVCIPMIAAAQEPESQPTTTATAVTGCAGAEIEVPPENHRNENQDFADCVVGCGNEGASYFVDIESTPFSISGVIDSGVHSYPNANVLAGPDADVIGIRTSGRTLLEIIVRSNGSAMDPVVMTHDGTRLMTYNDDATGDSFDARTVVAMPFTTGLPLYVMVTDATNYNNLSSGGPFVGGATYSYEIIVRPLRLEPTNLGTLTADSGPLQVSGVQLPCAGDMQYYVFRGPANVGPQVTLTRTAGDEFVPFMVGHKTTSEQLIWYGYYYDTEGTGTVVLPPTHHYPCDTCGETEVEFIVGVTDWTGNEFSGVYSYDLQVDAVGN